MPGRSMNLTRDLGLRLWRSGYLALPEERSRQEDADVLESTLLGSRAVVVRGRAGAELFYDAAVVERSGAVPPPLANLLFGAGAVHGLDDEEHAERKSMFLDILTEERTEELSGAIGADLDRRVSAWSGEVTVFDELVEVYGATVQRWAGISEAPRKVQRTSHRLARIVDGFGGAPVAYSRAWAARLRANRWARGWIAAARDGWPKAPPGSVLEEFATGRAAVLPLEVAAVELLNILRPTVAVAWPATFLARELGRYPHRRRLLDEPDGPVAFGHEVRRTCPFVPALAGRIRQDAVFGGVRLTPGDFLVLDVPGTHLDPAQWEEPGAFRSERFRGVMPDPFAFVPQGGGDPTSGHRCPGEPFTVAILAETARVLAGTDYTLCGDVTHDPKRIPTLPAHGLRLRV